jgi:hypothetical protein
VGDVGRLGREMRKRRSCGRIQHNRGFHVAVFWRFLGVFGGFFGGFLTVFLKF